MALLSQRGKEFKRKIIAEAAYDLLSCRPYESVTVDEIANHVGCGKGTLYRHFECKDHILTYLLLNRLDSLCADIKKECIESEDFLTGINQYLTLQFCFFFKNSQIISSWLRRSVDVGFGDQLLEDVNKKLENKLHMVALLLERGIQEKSLRPVDPYELARLLENIIRDSTISVIHRPNQAHEPDKVLGLMKQILSRGLLLEPGQ
ncbi:MAG: TetR/AcrR family transcriptional regulator [Bacillota bacterium]|nr:TetR/AcrR family transcriptional regulator [Bacillota bacterium]